MSLSPEKKQILNDIRPYLFILLVTYVLILALIAFSAWLKLSDFKDYQEEIAQSTAQGTATEITLFIRDLEHRLTNFTLHYNDLLSDLSDNPSDNTTEQQLQAHLKQEIPEAFTYTIATREGNPLFEQFENPVARACQVDIRKFAQLHKNHIVFHTAPVTNHFDVMEDFTDHSGRERIFFVSFKANIMSPLLARHRLPGYDVVMTSKTSPDTIDISPTGSRQTLDRDIFLSSDELKRINVRVDVENTGWQIVSIPSWTIYQSQLYSVLWRVILSFIAITLIALGMLYLLIKHQKSQHRSKQRYEQLFHANKAPMMLIEPSDGSIVDANLAADEYYGLSDTLKGQHASVISNLSNDEIMSRLADSAAEKQDHFFSEHRLASGEVRNVEIRSGPIEIDGRKIIYSIINDITARKNAERALVASEVRFKTLTSLSPVGTFFTDAAGICSYVNQAWATITGIDEQNWQGKTWTNAIYDSDREKIISDWATTVLKHGNYEVECRIQRPDGDVCWILCRATSVQDYADNTTMYIGTAIDITERKKNEHELKLLATSFEAYEPIIITDSQARILRVNDAFTRTSGFREDEILGKNPHMFSAGQTDKVFYDEMWSQLTTYGNWSGEMLNATKSGELHQDWVTITALRDDNDRITNYIGHFQDITERKKAEEQIRKLAFYDPLTNLPNRRLFLERLDQELQIARNEKKFSALLFLDLDHFKNLNDSLGHPMGDALLMEVSKRLQETRTEGEIIARIGGDEFVILLPDLASSTEQLSSVAAHRAEQASNTITQPYYIHGHEYHITVSIGIALFPETGQQTADILKRADTAMYRAKQAGRNTVCFFEQEMQTAADRRLMLEKDLRHAISHDELFLVYQPMVNGEDNVISAEVLLRWEHNKLGMIPPADFIHIAEDTGMIFDISEWILNQVCLQLREWMDDGCANHLHSIAINLSPKQFSQSGFEHTALSIVNQYGIEPDRIEFEITEGLIINNIENSVSKMESMKKHGFRFSIDDFGTGYSSLAYLKQLPINRLKIDQSFVNDITEDSNEATIVETIISMAHHLGLEVVAEGVENQMQHDFLMQHSCDIYQGYYFSKPVHPEEFIQIDIQQDVSLAAEDG